MPAILKFAPPIITVDVEDWPQSTWDRSLPITERAARNTYGLLDLLDELGVRVTMFVLTKLAETFPEIAPEIHRRGHEVASHGHGHVEIFKQTPDDFAADVKRSKEILEQQIGARLRGYRAPDFSIVESSRWALDVLAECGFEYDSSIFPVKRPRYGIPDWPLDPQRVQLENGREIVEFPIAAYHRFGKNWPVGGGGYHRLLPGWMSRSLAGTVMQTAPFVFYCHPYEFDPNEFRELDLPIPTKVRLHQGLGRRRFKPRFAAFVKRFSGQRIVDVLDKHDWPKLTAEWAAPLLDRTQAASG